MKATTRSVLRRFFALLGVLSIQERCVERPGLPRATC